MDKTDDLPVDYLETIKEIKERIRKAQYTALRAVNKELIQLYWDIGKIIVEKQEESGTWGKSVVERLSCDLLHEFSGSKGFSSSNLWRMKSFYEAYRSNEKVAQLVREIPWGQNIVILEKCKDPLQREFYIRTVRKNGWSRKILVSSIKDQTYERTMISQTNFEKALPELLRDEAHLCVKDEYSFDFLEMGDKYSERQLEDAILKKIPSFLREMGGMLAFIGNQFRLVVDDQEFFIDLLLYHRHLDCLIAIELKNGDFRPEYVGKMQFYLEALDRQVKRENENPSIGIILCKSKKRMVVEYTLARSQTPIGVSEYRTMAELPKNLEQLLPSREQIGRLLGGLE